MLNNKELYRLFTNIKAGRKIDQKYSFLEQIYRHDKYAGYFNFYYFIPDDVYRELMKWEYVSKSPYSFSFYNCKGKSWKNTPDKCLRISDHWNFKTEYDNYQKIHAPLDTELSTNRLNQRFILAKYNERKKIYEKIKEYPREVSFIGAAFNIFLDNYSQEKYYNSRIIDTIKEQVKNEIISASNYKLSKIRSFANYMKQAHNLKDKPKNLKGYGMNFEQIFESKKQEFAEALKSHLGLLASKINAIGEAKFKELIAPFKPLAPIFGVDIPEPKVEAPKPKIKYIKDTIIKTPSQNVEAFFGIIELDDIMPSHDPFTFKWSENYPKRCQVRDYAEDKQSQRKVMNIADKFDPDIITSDIKESATGTIIINKNGYVLGGNGRTMSLKRFIDRKGFQSYLSSLKKSSFGENDYSAFKKPVVVRVVEIDLKECPLYSKIFNDAVQEESDQTRESLTFASLLSENDVLRIAEIINSAEKNTFKQAMEVKSIVSQILSIFRAKGIIRDMSAKFTDEYGAMTMQGRDMVEATLLGKLFPSKKHLKAVKSYTNKLIFALPQLLKINSFEQKYNLIQYILRAIEKGREMKASGQSLEDFFNQDNMFVKESADDVLTNLVLETLEKGKLTFRDILSSYIRSVEANTGNAMFSVKDASAIRILEKILEKRKGLSGMNFNQIFESKKQEFAEALKSHLGLLASNINAIGEAKFNELIAPFKPLAPIFGVDIPEPKVEETPKPISAPVPSGDSNDCTVNVNIDKGGIEITFDGVPAESVRQKVKTNGFRWSRRQKLWYAKKTDLRLKFANELCGIAEEEVVEPAPITAPEPKKVNKASAMADLIKLQRILPQSQYEATKDTIKNNGELAKEINNLYKIYKDIPRKKELTNAYEDKFYLHYFVGGSDWYISDLDKNTNTAFGFAVINGDWEMAEFGYISIDELKTLEYPDKLLFINLDYYFEPQSIYSVLKDNTPNWLLKKAPESIKEIADNSDNVIIAKPKPSPVIEDDDDFNSNDEIVNNTNFSDFDDNDEIEDDDDFLATLRDMQSQLSGLAGEFTAPKSNYVGLFQDTDKDGLPDIDDKYPNNPMKTETIELIKVSDSFDKLFLHRQKVMKLENKLKKQLDKFDKDDTAIYSRVKLPYSTINKLINKFLENESIDDFLGLMIVADTYDQLREFREIILEGTFGNILFEKDFYEKPNNGYRAYHYILEVEGINWELQLKTKRMKELFEISHPLYKYNKLDGEKLLEYSTIMMEADLGDKSAINKADKLMKDKMKLENLLTSK